MSKITLALRTGITYLGMVLEPGLVYTGKKLHKTHCICNKVKKNNTT